MLGYKKQKQCNMYFAKYHFSHFDPSNPLMFSHRQSILWSLLTELMQWHSKLITLRWRSNSRWRWYPYGEVMQLLIGCHIHLSSKAHKWHHATVHIVVFENVKAPLTAVKSKVSGFEWSLAISVLCKECDLWQTCVTCVHICGFPMCCSLLDVDFWFP